MDRRIKITYSNIILIKNLWIICSAFIPICNQNIITLCALLYMQNIILMTLRGSNKLKFYKTASKWKENSIHECDSMLPCVRERLRRCTVLRANRKSASQYASRRQKSGEWPNNGRKFVSTDQFSTWCRPRLRGKTWPTTPRKRAYTKLKRCLLHCE